MSGHQVVIFTVTAAFASGMVLNQWCRYHQYVHVFKSIKCRNNHIESDTAELMYYQNRETTKIFCLCLTCNIYMHCRQERVYLSRVIGSNPVDPRIFGSTGSPCVLPWRGELDYKVIIILIVVTYQSAILRSKLNLSQQQQLKSVCL